MQAGSSPACVAADGSLSGSDFPQPLEFNLQNGFARTRWRTGWRRADGIELG